MDKKKLSEADICLKFTTPALAASGWGVHEQVFQEFTFPWVSPKGMKVDRIEDSQDHVSSKALDETRLPLVAKNSLLVVVRGMILVHSFPVTVTAREVTLNQDKKSFTPYIEGLTDFPALALKGFKPEILGLVAR